MSSIPQVSEAMNMFLSTRAKALERETGFVQRSTAELDGPIFVQTCVLTWMHLPQASYSHLQHTAASLGVQVSNQAIEQRFGQASCRLMRRLLEEAVSQVISSEAMAPELLARFNGVYLQDGTVLSLPPSLAEQWQGSGGVGEEAAMRRPRTGGIGLRESERALAASCARAAERSGPAIDTPLPPGSLFHADMGYFTLEEMRRPSRVGAVLAQSGQGDLDHH